MTRSYFKVREEARRLYLTGEANTNAEIAGKLRVKPHTVSKWRKEEDWDGLRVKIDRRVGEMFAEKIASERVTLNIRHYRMWDLLLAQMAEDMKGKQGMGVREMERLAGILDKAQKGQRLAKGLSITGEAEEVIRSQMEAELRSLIDVFVDSIKEAIPDEGTREKVRQRIVSALPAEEGEDSGEPRHAFAD